MKALLSSMLASLTLALAACGGGVDASPSGNPGSTSSAAEFVFDCNLSGANGVLTLQVEAISSSGAV